MRGYALSLTNLLPPSHLSIDIKFKSFAFSIAATHSLIPTPKPSLLLSTHHSKSNSHFSFSVAAQQQVQPGEEENIQLVSSIKTDYNDILIVDTPKARMLLLDSSCTPLTFSPSEFLLKVQTLLHGSSGSEKYSNSVLHFLINVFIISCFLSDEFASLPAIVPKGPIAILGWWNCSSSDA
ncbi:hypothetical protein LR48_Vigan05g039600 [Vigna angularis]|uniref:Uncharacterized protein n=1 Tax=Phaseolus angularis TaxID=3914 RepID=A0A0L9UJP8_PHAAN|nr:hypothetical protein LR48_Vigan05g039600 [Vigna angularis]